jgi:hypothetical protein
LELSTNLAKNAKGGLVKHPLSANVGIGGCETAISTCEIMARPDRKLRVTKLGRGRIA